MHRREYRYLRLTMVVRGFTLIELMVAVTLGILVSVGLVTVFDAVSTNNKVQQSMAEMQENGRYAITRINDDLRLASRQQSSISGYSGGGITPGINGALNLAVAPDVYKANIPFPDGVVTPPTGWINTSSHWPLSPAYFMSGTVPSYVPATGTTNGARVQGADVITMRYLNTEGWSSYSNEIAVAGCAAGSPYLTSVTLTPLTGTYASPPSNFVTGDLVLLTSSSGDESIFPVTVSGSSPTWTLTPTTASLLHVADKIRCPGSGEVKVSNFSRDFLTVTYWLKLVADPQVTSPQRYIPTLVRTDANNVSPTPTINHLELVQGVEQMNFLYGVQTADGKVEYVSDATVSADGSALSCSPPPFLFSDKTYFTAALVPVYEIPPAFASKICLWRSVKSVEAHILIDSVNNLFTLGPDEWQYTYNYAARTAPASAAALMPSGLPAGSMMRREFITLVSIRNYNN
jgi:type IV pilus assembly protein PilW